MSNSPIPIPDHVKALTDAQLLWHWGNYSEYAEQWCDEIFWEAQARGLGKEVAI